MSNGTDLMVESEEVGDLTAGRVADVAYEELNELDSSF